METWALTKISTKHWRKPAAGGAAGKTIVYKIKGLMRSPWLIS
jgi:hypothetical protein